MTVFNSHLEALVCLSPFREINQGIIDTQRRPWITQPLDVCFGSPSGHQRSTLLWRPRRIMAPFFFLLLASSLVDGLFLCVCVCVSFLICFCSRLSPSCSRCLTQLPLFFLTHSPTHHVEENSVSTRREKEAIKFNWRKKNYMADVSRPPSSQWTSRKENELSLSFIFFEEKEERQAKKKTVVDGKMTSSLSTRWFFFFFCLFFGPIITSGGVKWRGWRLWGAGNGRCAVRINVSSVLCVCVFWFFFSPVYLFLLKKQRVYILLV